MKHISTINGFSAIIFAFVFLVVLINGVVGGFSMTEVAKNAVVYGAIVSAGVWVVLSLIQFLIK